MGQKFKALTAEERAPYDAKHVEDKERYEKEFAEYSAKNPSVSAPVPPSSEKKAAATSTSPKPSTGNKDQKKQSSAKKRKKSGVSVGSATLFAAFLGKNKKQKTD